MNEIKLSKPDIAYRPSVVTYDFTAIDEDIQELEKRYLKWVPSEDEIADGTKIAKDINQLAEGLNNEKKEMKRSLTNRESRLKKIQWTVISALKQFAKIS